MAKIYADTDGVIIRFLATLAQEHQYPDPPAGTVWTLAFDENTNQGIVTAYGTNSNQFTMPGGTLTQTVAGVPAVVAINPPGLAYLDRDAIATGLAKLFAVPKGDSLTTAEMDALFRDHLRRTNQAPANQ